VLRLLAQKGTRSSYPLWTREQSNAPSLRLGYVVPIIHATMGVSDSSTEHPFPLRCVTVYRVGYVGCHPTTRRGLPSPSTRFPNIPRPIHRRVLWRCISKSFHAFCCLHHHHAGFGSLLARLREYTLTMRQDSLNVTDCWVAMTSLLCLDRSLTGRLLRGGLVVTSAGLTPASGLTFIWARRGACVWRRSSFCVIMRLGGRYYGTRRIFQLPCPERYSD
jgi:hypothetical protein